MDEVIEADVDEQGTGAATSDRSDGFPSPTYAWYVLFLIFLAAGFAFVDRIGVSLLTPAIEADLGISDSRMGLLQGVAFALFYTLFGIPLGVAADRWSRKWLVTIGITAWSLMTASCGVSTGFGTLFLGRLGVGTGEASMHPCATSLISDFFPPRTRPRAFAVYVMGGGVGHGLTYIFGGMLLGWLTMRGGLHLPGLGLTKPWQSMFIIIGAAGLIPALLFALTVKEPKRQEFANKDREHASSREVRAFMAMNRGTLFCHHMGIALTIMTAYAFGNWMPTFFLRVHGWQPQRFSVIYGSVSIVFAIITPYITGRLTALLKDRGVTDASWRIIAVSSVGCTTCGAIAPLMPTPETSLLVYILAGIFANPPAVLAFVAISEFVPNEMRGVITGVYFLLVGLLSTGLGPFAVGFATDYLFQNNAAIGRSLSLVSLVTGVPAGILLVIGLRSFRASIGRATWITPASAPERL